MRSSPRSGKRGCPRSNREVRRLSGTLLKLLCGLQVALVATATVLAFAVETPTTVQKEMLDDLMDAAFLVLSVLIPLLRSCHRDHR